MKRGFTLIELANVLVISSIVFGAGGALYLEGRVAATRLEAQVGLQRQASLAAEWIGRELRSADRVEPGEDGLSLADADRALRFGVEEERLFVEEAGERHVIARGVTALRVDPEQGRWRVHLVLERRLIQGREVRIERDFWIARRR